MQFVDNMEKFVLGRKIIRLEQVNSTNLFAKELSSYIKPLYEGTIVITQDQLSGKGRHQKSWLSEKNKNLCMSIILFPKFLDSSNLFMLSKAISLSISDYLVSLKIEDVKIKWPNDILVAGKKIAGILIENSWKSNSITESVVGIGLNVNQTHFPDVLPPPLSLKLIKKSEFEMDQVLTEISKYIEVRYEQLRNNNFSELSKDYFERLYKLREISIFISKGEEFQGTVLGVNPDGKLKIRTTDRSELEFDLDEVSFKRESQPIF